MAAEKVMYKAEGFRAPDPVMDKELELGILGGCLLSPDLAAAACEVLEAEDFSSPRCRSLFGAVQRGNETADCDRRPLADRIATTENAKRLFMIEAMSEYTAEAPSGDAYAACLRRLKLQSAKRKAAREAWLILCDASHDDADAEAFAAYIGQRMSGIAEAISKL